MKLYKVIKSDAVPVNEKLANAKSLSTVKSIIYKAVEPLVKGFKRDADWSNVHKVFKFMRSLGLDVTVVKDDYKLNDKGELARKVYDWKAEFVNAMGKKIELKGSLTASLAGTVENPFEKYDMIFQIF